jgi:2,4-dienoyl-CoA reductase-like NADH-dependent reductase (Old Yellow Enzyme family)
MGVGYPATPGVWSAEQVDGWKQVTSAVHKAGGRILLQLWHVGRLSHPFFLNGALPVAPSAIAAKGELVLEGHSMAPIPHRARLISPKSLPLLRRTARAR